MAEWRPPPRKESTPKALSSTARPSLQATLKHPPSQPRSGEYLTTVMVAVGGREEGRKEEFVFLSSYFMVLLTKKKIAKEVFTRYQNNHLSRRSPHPSSEEVGTNYGSGIGFKKLSDELHLVLGQCCRAQHMF